MATFLMVQWQPTPHGFSEKQPMATFLVVQKAANFQKWPVFHGSMAPTLMGAKATLC